MAIGPGLHLSVKVSPGRMWNERPMPAEDAQQADAGQYGEAGSEDRLLRQYARTGPR
jgi:hypothetical protein